MDATTEKLVDYTLATQFEDLPDAVTAAAKDRILDTLGCVAGGYDHPVSVTARRLAARYSMDTPATIFGSGDRAAPEMAAFANSVMLRVLDMSDTYRVKSGGHPSDIMGAAFAAAEIGQVDGRSLITAIATGYEIYCGCCAVIDLNSQGWDQPVYGVIASALCAGKLMGLNRDQLAHAVALAAVPNMATIQTRKGELSAWKGCAGANASRNGLFAALLAQEGITGPDMPFEGKFGMQDIVGPIEWPLEPGEAPHRIAHTNLKSYAICYHGQAAAWAAMDLRDGINVDDIESIDVATYDRSFEMMASSPSNWSPKTRETADHSLPYVVGTALLNGVLGEASFSDQALHDPSIGALMQRISVAEDSALSARHPEYSPSRLTIRLKDGTEVAKEVDAPKGDDKNPMTADEVKAKFKTQFTVYGDDAQADAVMDAVYRLDAASDIAPLVKAMTRQTSP
jgi:2-methylcitrate dehydratase